MRDKLFFLIPGDLQAGTGGYAYDRRMIAELRALGWTIDVRALDASFPQPSTAALEHADRVLTTVPDGSLVLIDGLAVSPTSQVLRVHAQRLRLLALLHMPLSANPSIDPAQRESIGRMEADALRSVRRVIVTGPGSSQHLLRRGITGIDVVVIEPGTDPAVQAPSFAASGEAVRLLCVATMQAGKGHALLLEALHDLCDLPWQLTCVGNLTRSPDTVARLRVQLDRLGLAPRVTLLGELEPAGVYDQYRHSDLFVLPTLFESYGMAVAEALAHGLPVIGTHTGAIPKLVAGKAGLVIPCGDRAALTGALADLLRSPARRLELARGATEVAATLPRWSDAATGFAQALTSVSH
jgi:glycosyltransferase involved in cell wall biosynthesis